MILSNTDYAIELFQAIKKKLDVPYGCMVRVEHVNPEIIDIMASNGCRYVAMGIECGNEKFRRKHLNRRMSNQQIENAFFLAKRAGIFTTSFNMIGYPFDNDEFLTKETISLNKKISPDFVQVSIFYPFPETKLYQRCIDMDLIDFKKVENAREYFSESVLRGVSLKEKLGKINRLFNPHGFNFAVDGYSEDNTKAMSSLYQYMGSKPFLRFISRKLPAPVKTALEKVLRLLTR